MKEERYKGLEEEFEEIDLREYLEVLNRRKKLIGGVFIVTLMLSVIVTFFILDPIYQAEAMIKLSNSSKDYSNKPFAIEKLKSLNFLRKVNQKLNLDFDDNQLTAIRKNALKIENSGESNLLVLRYESKVRKEVEPFLSGIIKMFMEKSYQELKKVEEIKSSYLAEIKREIDKLDKEIRKRKEEGGEDLVVNDLSIVEKIILNNNYSDKVQDLNNFRLSLINKKYLIEQELNNIKRAEVINEAIVPRNPIAPNKKLNLAIAAILGLMIGVFVAFIVEFFKDEEELLVGEENKSTKLRKNNVKNPKVNINC